MLVYAGASYALGARPPRDFINKLMSINFGVMESLGDDVMRPFLQDVVKFGSLGKTLATMTATKPLFVPQILAQGVGGTASSEHGRRELCLGERASSLSLALSLSIIHLHATQQLVPILIIKGTLK